MKNMTNFFIVLGFIGAIMVAISIVGYRYYSGKRNSERHSESQNERQEIKEKIDGTTEESGNSINVFNSPGAVVTQDHVGDLTVNMTSKPRIIEQSEADILISNLKKLPPKTIIIRALMSDAESQNLANSFKNIFESSGWTIKENSIGLKNDVYKLKIGFPMEEIQSQQALTIWKWLERNNLNPPTADRLITGETEYIIFVGINN